MTDEKRAAAPGLRELTRASVREQIADRALQLFDENGFDETTVDDVAAAIGLSARSFFRYFPSKEDVVLGDTVRLGELVRDTAAERPAGESAWQVLRRAFDPIADYTEAGRINALRSMRVLMSAPSLRARNLEKHIAWAILLEPVIEARLADAASDRRYRAQVLVHSALSCLDVAFAEWTRQRGAPGLHTLLDKAFETLR